MGTTAALVWVSFVTEPRPTSVAVIRVPKCAGLSSTKAVAPPDAEERKVPTMRVPIEIAELDVWPESLQSITVPVPITTKWPAAAPPLSVTQLTVPYRATSTLPVAETVDIATP